MNRIRYLIVLTCAAMFPQIAFGFILDPCWSAGQARLLAAGPGPNDPIGFTLFVPFAIGSEYPYPQYKYYWISESKSEASSNTFVVDLILTDDSTTFPGHTLVDQYSQNWGFIGPLPAGNYTILGTVNVYDPATGSIHPECDPATFGPAQKASNLFISGINNPTYQASRAPEAPVVEYYNAALDDYFMTMNPAEMRALDFNSPPGWFRTNYAFYAYVPNTRFSFDGSSNTNVLRYYDTAGPVNSHFFTFNNAEAASLSSAWVLETDNAFEIWEPLRATGYCPPNTLPVYRLFNGRTNHRYTIDPGVRADMISKGWIPEGYGPDGVVMCSPGT